jgi:hypothetical protein
MSGGGDNITWSPQGHHKRAHEEFIDPSKGGPQIRPSPPVVGDYNNPQQQPQQQQQLFTKATAATAANVSTSTHHKEVGERTTIDRQYHENSSQESSHKRARLYGEYRDNSSIMEDESSTDNLVDDDNEDGETALCSNIAVRGTSDDANSRARWMLRSSTSNYSITSTLTEVSDTVDTTFETTADTEGQPLPPLPIDAALSAPSSVGGEACIILQSSAEISVGDQVENLTNRMERSWSLSRMKTRRISNTPSGQTATGSSETSIETMSDTARKYRQEQTKQAKREIMRAFRKSNSTSMDYSL